MAILLALLPDAGHDQLWLLLAAARIGPHTDPYGPLVFESNPPLALWLSGLVVALAHVFHLSFTVTFKLSVILLAGVSALLCARLVHLRQRPITDRWYLSFLFLLISGVLPARDFGQRDHILMLLVLPYLLAAALHLAGKSLSSPQRWALTLLAALGLALKPHQALIALAVELTLLLNARPRHPRLLEPALFLASAATYLLAIQTLAPTYFTQVVPALRSTYWAFGTLPPAQLLRASFQLQILLVAALTFVLLSRPKSPIAVIFLAAGLAADLAYALQGTGWYYQQLPALSFLTLALAAQLLRSKVLRRLQPPSWTLPAISVLALLALTLTFVFSHFHLDPTQPFPANIEQPQPIPDPAFFRNLPPGTPVATLTTSVDDSVLPAFRYHLVLAQRYPHLWLLPAILRNQSGPVPSHRIPPARLQQLDLQQHRFLVEDLIRWHPTLLLVERCQDSTIHCQVLEDRHDNLLAFFLRDPAFVRIFACYHFARSSGPYDAYLLQPESCQVPGSTK